MEFTSPRFANDQLLYDILDDPDTGDPRYVFDTVEVEQTSCGDLPFAMF